MLLVDDSGLNRSNRVQGTLECRVQFADTDRSSVHRTQDPVRVCGVD
jgi:hypothetical protein